MRFWQHYGIYPAGTTIGRPCFGLTGYRWDQGRLNGATTGNTNTRGGLIYPGSLNLTPATEQRVDLPYEFGVTPYDVDDIFTNATAATVLVVYRKMDSTLRQSVAFGVSADGGGNVHRILAHVPWEDGNVYWDYGGSTAGVSRVSGAWTADTNWHWWAFVVGSGQGMRIYLDGRLLASNAATPTRTFGGGGGFRIGMSNFALSDRAEISEIAGFDRGISQGEVVEWMRQSQAGHPDTFRWRNPRSYLFFGNQDAGGGGGFQEAWARRANVVLSPGIAG